MKSFWLINVMAFIRYIDTEAAAKPLVFLHGLGAASTADFAETVADSRFRDFRCLLIDFLGFGYSDKPADFRYSLSDHAATIATLLDQLQLTKAIVVGHSMGGTVAIALAQTRPDLVSRLIVIEPNLDPGVGSISKVIASQSESDFFDTGYPKIVRALRLSAHHNQADSIYLATFSGANPIAIYRSAVGLLEGTRPPQRELLSRLAIPKIFIASEQNRDEIPQPELLALGLAFYVVPDSGHAMMHDNPEGFKQILLKSIMER